MNRWLLVALVAACSHPVAPPPAPSPVCAPSAQDAVVQAMVDWYATLATDNLDGFHASVTSDFYAYERGARMDGDALAHAIADAHAKGRKFEWKVTEPHVIVDCHLASIAFVNVGAIGDATAMQAVSWVESAAFRYEGGRWRLAFFHSTRVPPPTPPS